MLGNMGFGLLGGLTCVRGGSVRLYSTAFIRVSHHDVNRAEAKNDDDNSSSNARVGSTERPVLEVN